MPEGMCQNSSTIGFNLVYSTSDGWRTVMPATLLTIGLISAFTVMASSWMWFSSSTFGHNYDNKDEIWRKESALLKKEDAVMAAAVCWVFFYSLFPLLFDEGFSISGLSRPSTFQQYIFVYSAKNFSVYAVRYHDQSLGDRGCVMTPRTVSSW